MKTKWHFEKKSVEKMFRLLDYSNEFHIEYGSLLCFDDTNKEIVAGTMCEGDACNIKYKDNSDCGSLKADGTYHTHPDRKHVIPALNDLIAHLEDKDIISCIGADNEIKCYMSKDEDTFWSKESIQEIKEQLKIEKQINERKKVDIIDELSLSDFTKYILNRYFDTVELKHPR